MKFIYCQSYQAFNLALYYNLKEEITVVSSSRNIINACDFLKVNYLPHQHYSFNEMVYNEGKVKSELEGLVRTIGESEFHFSHTQFAIFCFILVKNLNDRGGKTIFHNFEFVYNKVPFFSFFHKNYLYHWIFKNLLHHRYNLSLEVRMSSAKSYMIGFNLKYLNENCYRTEDDKNVYFELTLDLFKNISIDSISIENLFIGQTFNNANFFEKDKIDALLPTLNRPTITLKNHPKLGKIEGLSKCSVLPDYLPVEFFFNKVQKTIISFHSSSLVTASMFENVKVISLLKIVGVQNEFCNSVIGDLTNKSKGKIIFPETLEEFESYLK